MKKLFSILWILSLFTCMAFYIPQLFVLIVSIGIVMGTVFITLTSIDYLMNGGRGK